MVSEKQELGYKVHPSAIVDEGARIGVGTRIWHWVHVQGNSVIGDGCSLGQNVYVGKAVIGNNVKIQNNVSVYDGVALEDDVFCGPSMVFTNVINPRSHIERKHEYKRTLGKAGCHNRRECGDRVRQYDRTVCDDWSGLGCDKECARFCAAGGQSGSADWLGVPVRNTAEVQQ